MSAPLPPKRIIWAFAGGYFLAYMLYAPLVKSAANDAAEPNGLQLLVVTFAGMLCTMLAGITLFGWWRYARVVTDWRVILSGGAAAVIIATTTIAYCVRGMSIVLVLLLLRGGVLILAPIIDTAAGRKVRWFCWTALFCSFAALAVALMNLGDATTLTVAAILNIGLYLTGYLVRLPIMTKMAKVRDTEIARRYLIDELLVALVILVAAVVIPAGVSGGVREAIAGVRGASFFGPAFLAGVAYGMLYLFGTLVYLDSRENTFCVPLNRCSSLLAGIAGTYVVSSPPAGSELVAASLMCVALLLLSPAHHLFEFAPRAKPAPALAPVNALEEQSG